MARIYREMPLNSIWEGAANIMGLDLLRAVREAAGAAACGAGIDSASIGVAKDPRPARKPLFESPTSSTAGTASA